MSHTLETSPDTRTPCDCGEPSTHLSQGTKPTCARCELPFALESTPEDWTGGKEMRDDQIRRLRLEILPDAIAHPLWLRIRRDGFTPDIDAEIERAASEVLR